MTESDDLAALQATLRGPLDGFHGAESRELLDNWFRTDRRISAVLDAFAGSR